MARRRWRRRFASCASSGECIRSKSRPVSPMATTSAWAASSTIVAQSASVVSEASCGCTPTAASTPNSRARLTAAAEEPASQLGTRIRSTPAALAAAMTAARSEANASAWRWAWLSIRRIVVSPPGRAVDLANPRPASRPRSRAAGRVARGQSRDPARPDGRPTPGSATIRDRRFQPHRIRIRNPTGPRRGARLSA